MHTFLTRNRLAPAEAKPMLVRAIVKLRHQGVAIGKKSNDVYEFINGLDQKLREDIVKDIRSVNARKHQLMFLKEEGDHDSDMVCRVLKQDSDSGSSDEDEKE